MIPSRGLRLLIAVFAVWIGFGAVQAGWTQVLVSAGPSDPIRPFSVATYEERHIPESELTSVNDGVTATPALTFKEEFTEINAFILRYFRLDRHLTYRKKAEMAQTLSTDEIDIEAEDLPELLQEVGWEMELPIHIDKDVIFVRGGASITSDNKDIDNLDYNTFVQFGYVFDPEADFSWQLGLLQRSVLGEISAILPFGMLSIGDGDDIFSIGVIHLPEHQQNDLLPFFGYSSKGKIEFELEIVLPYRVTLITRITENLLLEGQIERESTLYRLTQDDPWEDAIFASERTASTAALNYHLLDVLLLKFEVGVLASRLYEIQNRDGNKLTEFELQEGNLATGGIAIAFDF